MRDIASCFSDEALNFSSPSCSSNASKSYVSPSPSYLPSICNAITYLYRSNLRGRKARLLLTVNWCRAPAGQRLIVGFGPDSDSPESTCIQIGMNPWLLGRNRGQKKMECQNSNVVVSWDFSKAKFDAGSPEPVSGFYVAVYVDSELALVLGDAKGTDCQLGLAKPFLVSRKVELSGDGLYSTKARFGQDGELHDVLIKCRGAELQEGGNDQWPHSMLRVYVDKKLAMRVERLQWNFRGSQTIFVGGLAIDIMWNVHDWFYNSGVGLGVFLFKARTKKDVGCWVEEKMENDDEGGDEDGDGDSCSLLIIASAGKSPI